MPDGILCSAQLTKYSHPTFADFLIQILSRKDDFDWSQEKWSFMPQQTPATAQAIPEVHGVLSHKTLPSYFLVLTNAKDWPFALRSKFKRGNHWTSVFQYRRTTLVQSTTGRWGSKNMSSCSQNLKRTWPLRSIHVLISHSRNHT